MQLLRKLLIKLLIKLLFKLLTKLLLKLLIKLLLKLRIRSLDKVHKEDGLVEGLGLLILRPAGAGSGSDSSKPRSLQRNATRSTNAAAAAERLQYGARP